MEGIEPEGRQSGRRVVVASNRGPVTLVEDDSGLHFQRGSGGLVTALIGLARQIHLTWVSVAQTGEDSQWREGDVSLNEECCELHISFITPGESAYEGYYNEIANPLLWFLQHSMWDVPRTPIIDQYTWEAWEKGYRVVNRLFAEEIIRQIKEDPTPSLVMLQDYHLYLVARYINEILPRRERPLITHFIHIPWPGTEYWGILPPGMRQPILDGLCAVDLLGFQTREDALNFLRTCESYLPRASVSYKHGRIWYRNHATHVRDFPISIDVQALEATAASEEVAAYRAELSEIIAGRDLILRIDRIEPSKNIIRGFQAFDDMLALHPEHLEKVFFLAFLMPSRMDVLEYRNYLDDLMAAAGRINARYGTHQWEPVRIMVGENYPKAVAAMQLYDVLLVNAIADGMNLVAKEGPIVNQRDGVLILSERAGARQQLETGATLISPCDIYATAEALHSALVMDRDERQTRARRLHWMIEREDIQDWLQKQLAAIQELNL
jgi:trehalose 6-phosphate synthase